MGIHIVTGYAGKEHVTSADAGSMNAGIVGTGRYVMQTAEQFAAEIVSNNLIKVKSGDLMNQGRHMRIDVNDYEEVTIQNGAQSVFRNDLIVARYKKDPSTLIETTEIVVIKGTAGATATDPTYTSGDILAGATQDDFPLYRVSLNGLNIEKVTPLFSTVPNLDELNTNMGEMFHVVKMTRDNLTMTKGSEDYFYFNFPKKDGYSRVVMDIKVENASSNGYGVTYFKYITYKTPDDKSITIYGKNENTSRDIKLWMQVIVMYVNEKYANW